VKQKRFCAASLIFGLLCPAGAGGAVLSPEAVEYFESRIRPVLAQDCYECHRTGGKTKRGLALDHRAAMLKGGESGPVIVPGNPGKSLLMAAIRHHDEDLKMPKARAKLEDRIIADFAKWIEMGAADPRDKPSSEEEIAKDTDWAAVMERRKSWWSFQPVKKPEVPAGKSPHPVDRFIEAGLAKGGLQAAGTADRRTLIRRLSFALRGLPPTPEESEAFVKDPGAEAYERLVDRYLVSPQFGERWARHWMDWLRYADSHGSEGDPDIPKSWRYRDYLIRALNADVPYDQLVREHVAGDLLERPRISEGINESMFGTAHLRMVFHGFAPTDALDEQVRFTDDQISVLTKAFMALTVSCARCHDHKFDAISQKDYYALYGILASTKPGTVTVNAPGEEDEKRRARLQELKEQIRAAVAAQWLKSAESLTKDLSKPEGERIEKAGKPENVLYPVHVAAKHPGKPEELKKALEAWEAKQGELRAHRERKYRHDWNLADDDSGGTTYGPSAGKRARAGAFAISLGGDGVIQGIYPAGVYSHLISPKDPGVALSPRSMLDVKSELWARVMGGEDAMIRYAVQNYPRNGTVYPVGRLKEKDWKWQKWSLDYWEGDHIHLEVTTGPEQATLATNKDRSWFGIREVVIVKRGEPGPPGGLLDWVEPLLDVVGRGTPADSESLAKVYGTATQEAVASWRKDEASDGQAMLLQELMVKGLLPNKADEIPGVKPLLDEYRKLEAEIVVPTRVPGVWEADSFDQPLFERGNHKKPGEKVPRRFLEAIDGKPYRTTGSGRRELAEDLLRPDNPFTARVIANRLWHHLFGRGIVSTTDNFGRLGEKPSHPELLDDLAVRMAENGWSIKKAIRHLVTSETWKRSSVPSAGAKEKDPGNKLLSHFRVQRLEAEAIRDSLLAVTGELEDKMFGGPIKGAAPRRSVYMRVKRNDLDPFLTAFDAPVPASTVGRREVTNVPAQSLTMLNSDFVIGLAERWAGRVKGIDEAKAARMFTQAMGRPPTSEEVGRALEFVKAMAELRSSRGGERGAFEDELKESRAKLAELEEEARERVLAVRGIKPGEKKAGPAPIALWDFEGNGEDRVGVLHVKLHGGAGVADGALVVDGKTGFGSTPKLRQPLRAKTLEAWVQLDSLEQGGGGVMTVQTPRGVQFDSIVYAEVQKRRWMAGSEGHKRTKPFEGKEEDTAQSAQIHLAITYAADGTVTAYRQGQPYGKPYKSVSKGFAAGDANVLFGCRHGEPGGNLGLNGRIFEARLYDRALSAEEIMASASKNANFISEQDLLAAMSEAERKERADLLAEREKLKKKLEGPKKPDRPNNEWADYAHALFNLKEFIYIR